MNTIMTEERARVLLLQIEKTKKDLSLVEAEILSCLEGVAIDTSKNRKSTKRLDIEAKIRASFHKT